MSNSKLVNYTKMSPYYTAMSNKVNRKITIHHMAGDLSVETCGNVFQNAEVSSNYGIDSDGRVGLYVDESDRSWASADWDNDSQAVTIEVANDEYGGNWHVSDKALAKLIDLCVDICERNGIKYLTYTGDASGNLTRHNMFIATTCPGPYLQSKFPYIAAEVNSRLADEDKYDASLRGLYTITANGGLNLRANSHGSADILETMPEESTCTCYGYFNNDWLYVEAESGKTGYCSKLYLKKILPFVDVSSRDWFYDSIKWGYEKKIISGSGNNKFNPNHNCTRAEAAMMIWSYYGKQPVNNLQPFDDIDKNDWFYTSAHWCRELGITSGTGENKFDPDSYCTRAQAIAMIWRASGSPEVNSNTDFKDIEESDYYYKAVKWAKANNITAGVSSDCFAPNDFCTRAQIITFLYRK